MAPNVPDSYLQARQQQIIEAAASCFSARGFHQTTMKDICQKAGLSAGAVYNYFPSKEDIVTRCAEMSQQRNQLIFDSITGKKTSDAFKTLVDTLFSLAKQDDIKNALNIDLELWAESTRNNKVYEAIHNNENAVIEMMSSMVKNGQDEGVFNREVDSISFARVLYSTFIGFEVQLVLNPNLDIDAYIAVLKSMVDGTLVKRAT